jgi:hypothetical protein
VTTERAITWSYGGGRQSVAIAVLVAKRRLPVPERILIADTGREDPATWEYLEEHVQPLLATVGARVEKIAIDSEPDLYAPSGELLLPVYAQDGGKLAGFCSATWKRDRILQHLRALGYGPQRPIVQWLGISVNEIGRAKESRRDWCQLHYPLLFDIPMRVDECIHLVLAHGLPMPPKSSCWMCPHRRNTQWADLRRRHPAYWQRAIAIDEEVRARDEQGGVYLHESRKPLAEINLAESDDPPPSLFGDSADCNTGYCFV